MGLIVNFVVTVKDNVFKIMLKSYGSFAGSDMGVTH